MSTKHSGEDAVPRFTAPSGSPFPLIPGNEYNPSPSLDVYTDLRLVDNRQLNTLNITGQITGDNFPATEVYITDNSGQALFLATGKPPAIASPIFNLPNYGQGPRDIADVHVTVNTDDAGNFVSVESNGQTISIEEWNGDFESRNPGFIDPTNPVNDAVLELREGYGEVGRELDEAVDEIGNAQGSQDITREVLEAGGEIIYESAGAVVETVDAFDNSVRETAIDIAAVGIAKILSWRD